MIFAAWCACCAMSVAAQDCEISLTIAKAAQKEELPSQVQEILGNRLAAAVVGQGSVANSNFTPFFITAKTNTLYKETLSGPPVSTALTVQLTLYIGDAVGQKVFSTLTVDAKGVGTNINRAYINAFRAINGNNVKIQEFIREGKEKIISWYNSNYRQILVKAQKSAYIFDNNEPKCILSPSRLRIPNSSYKLLGYIPDISGHGNHGVIHNSAYAEGSGVNEDGSYQFDGVDDFVTIPTTVGGKQVLMKVNWDDVIANAIIYDQRGYPNEFAIYNADKDNSNNPVFAYQARNTGQTYIDGILNSNIKASELKAITHNITITNELSAGVNKSSPVIGSNIVHNDFFVNMALYDFMLFDEISTDDKILELNEYVGIEGNTE